MWFRFVRGYHLDNINLSILSSGPTKKPSWRLSSSSLVEEELHHLPSRLGDSSCSTKLLPPTASFTRRPSCFRLALGITEPTLVLEIDVSLLLLLRNFVLMRRRDGVLICTRRSRPGVIRFGGGVTVSARCCGRGLTRRVVIVEFKCKVVM